MSTHVTLLFALSCPASFFLPKFWLFASLVCCSLVLALLSHFLVAKATRNCRYSSRARRWQSMHCSSAAARSACMHAHNSSSIERRPQFGSFYSFVNLDACVEDGLFFFFGAWIRRIRPIFSLPQLAFDLTSTPTIPDSCRQRSSISLTAVPRNHFEHSFRKARQLWTLSKLPSPCHYFEKRKKTTTRPKFFSTQSTVSPLHAPSSAGTCCLHVLSELGRGAESFLATESTSTVLIPRLMTRIAGHVLPRTWRSFWGWCATRGQRRNGDAQRPGQPADLKEHVHHTSWTFFLSERIKDPIWSHSNETDLHLRF